MLFPGTFRRDLMTGLEKTAQIFIITCLVMVLSDIFVQFKFEDKCKISGCSKLNLFTNSFVLPWTLKCYSLVAIQILIILLTTYLTLAEKFNLFKTIN